MIESLLSYINEPKLRFSSVCLTPFISVILSACSRRFVCVFFTWAPDNFSTKELTSSGIDCICVTPGPPSGLLRLTASTEILLPPLSSTGSWLPPLCLSSFPLSELLFTTPALALSHMSQAVSFVYKYERAKRVPVALLGSRHLIELFTQRILLMEHNQLVQLIVKPLSHHRPPACFQWQNIANHS